MGTSAQLSLCWTWGMDSDRIRVRGLTNGETATAGTPMATAMDCQK